MIHVPLKFRFLYGCRSSFQLWRGQSNKVALEDLGLDNWGKTSKHHPSSRFKKLGNDWPNSFPTTLLSLFICILYIHIALFSISLSECSVSFEDEIQDMFIILGHIHFKTHPDFNGYNVHIQKIYHPFSSAYIFVRHILTWISLALLHHWHQPWEAGSLELSISDLRLMSRNLRQMPLRWVLWRGGAGGPKKGVRCVWFVSLALFIDTVLLMFSKWFVYCVTSGVSYYLSHLFSSSGWFWYPGSTIWEPILAGNMYCGSIYC